MIIIVCVHFYWHFIVLDSWVLSPAADFYSASHSTLTDKRPGLRSPLRQLHITDRDASSSIGVNIVRKRREMLTAKPTRSISGHRTVQSSPVQSSSVQSSPVQSSPVQSSPVQSSVVTLIRTYHSLSWRHKLAWRVFTSSYTGNTLAQSPHCSVTDFFSVEKWSWDGRSITRWSLK